MNGIIAKYFPGLSREQIFRFEMLGDLYPEWNSKINVVSRKDIEALYEHHILHSLAIAKLINFAPQAKILDVGTGGGFPGIPLAIFFPEVQFHLIDSIAKKLKVVSAIADALQLTNVTVEHVRAEQVSGRYDFIVSRAVTSLPEFLPWVKGKFLNRQLHLLPNGMLFLKGGDLAEELKHYQDHAQITPISNFFEEPFFAEKKVVYLPSNCA